MLVRVPNFSYVKIDGTLTGSNYIILFRDNGLLEGTGTISADGLGFSEGAEDSAGGGHGGGYAGVFSGGSAGGGGYGTGYYTYGSASLDKLFSGSGGGGGGGSRGCSGSCNKTGDNGGSGGGVIFITGDQINFSGTISSNGGPQYCGDYCNGGGGSGGSIRIEGNSIALNNVTVSGNPNNTQGGLGRIAIYYFSSLTGYTCSSGNSCYSLNTSLALTPTPTGTLPTPTASPTPADPEIGVVSYNYTYPNHPHAAASLSNGYSYVYDANGNMTTMQSNHLWTMGYDVENHMVSQTSENYYTGSYLYDGDGVRVGQTVNGISTYYFAGGAYEVTVPGTGDQTVKKYYSIAGQMVAMDDGSGLQYILTDHLGSVVAVLSSIGALESQQRYLPSGKQRNLPNAITQTDYNYTGQRFLVGTKLLDFKSRFYDPILTGSFSQIQ